MHEHFYNLSADPFRLSPDHRFCYSHANYAKAKAYMAYAFMRAEGFVLITGDPGTGKTTLVGDLIESLADKNVAVANLVSTQLAADDLLRMIAFAFGVEAEIADKSVLLQHLTTHFLNLSRTGGRALLIVDEAQDLTPRALEELRLLTNLQEDGQPLLQIFLLGQPSLQTLIHTPGLEQVHQRIVAASKMEALGADETRAYVEHRLHVVGWQNDPAISSAVYPIIHLFSAGVPRRINLICSRLFLHGSVERRHQIAVQDARTVVEELQEEQLSTRNILHHELFHEQDEFELVLVPEPEVHSGAANGVDEKRGPERSVEQASDPAACVQGDLAAVEPRSQVVELVVEEAEQESLTEQQLAPEILDALLGEQSEEVDRPGAVAAGEAEPEGVRDQAATHDEPEPEQVIVDKHLPAEDQSSGFPVKWLIIGLGFAAIGGLLVLAMLTICGPDSSGICSSLEPVASRVLQWLRQV